MASDVFALVSSQLQLEVAMSGGQRSDLNLCESGEPGRWVSRSSDGCFGAERPKCYSSRKPSLVNKQLVLFYSTWTGTI